MINWRKVRPFGRALALIVFFLGRCLAQQEAGSSWQSAAEDFVRQILARAASPTAVNLTFANLSSLSSGEQTSLREAITNDFRNAGVRLVKSDSVQAEIEITFSEDWQSLVWVAEIKQNQTGQTVIQNVPRPERTLDARVNSLIIKKNLVWRQGAPFLDFYADQQNLFVLEAEQISLYANEPGGWRLKRTLAVSHDHPWPRDLRGRLKVNGLQIIAFLPGTLCTGSVAPPTLDCRASDDPWFVNPMFVNPMFVNPAPVNSGPANPAQTNATPPVPRFVHAAMTSQKPADLGFLGAFYSPARNFFTGVLAGAGSGESVSPFFSAAAVQNGNLRQWVFAGTDGRARIFSNELSSASIVVNDWGSNLAAIQSGCNGGWQILTTAPGDLNHSDSIQAYEVQGRQVVPVSAATDAGGPVLAFWQSDDPRNTHAIVLSAATGKIEAWSISVACN